MNDDTLARLRAKVEQLAAEQQEDPAVLEARYREQGRVMNAVINTYRQMPGSYDDLLTLSTAVHASLVAIAVQTNHSTLDEWVNLFEKGVQGILDGCMPAVVERATRGEGHDDADATDHGAVDEGTGDTPTSPAE